MFGLVLGFLMLNFALRCSSPLIAFWVQIWMHYLVIKQVCVNCILLKTKCFDSQYGYYKLDSDLITVMT